MNNKVAENKKLLTAATKIARAMEAEAEEILEHAEQVVKEYVPARYVKSALKKIEDLMKSEGVEVLFDKTVTREALRKTAKTEATASEIDETCEAIAKAVVAEFEDSLEDADEVADMAVARFEEASRFEVESKLKSIVEKKLASKGIYAKFARNQKN